MSSTPSNTSVAPSVQSDVTAQSALSIEAVTSSSPYGFSSAADANAMLALLEAIRAQQALIIAALNSKGFTK